MESEIEMSTGQLIPLDPRRKYLLYLMKPRLMAPQASLTMWVDMSLANTFRRHFESPIRLTYTHLIVKAAALALEEESEVNSVWTARGILHLGDIRIGLPVHVEGGTPDVVIENPQSKSLPLIAQELDEMAAELRSKPIRPGKEELLLRLPQTIATLAIKYLKNYPPPSVKRDFIFRITNFGQWGIDRTIPAITSSPMLTTGRVADRVMAVDGVLDIRPTVSLTLAYDCRVIDDTQASRFLVRLKDLLENPQTLS